MIKMLIATLVVPNPNPDPIHDQRHDTFEAQTSVDDNEKIRDAENSARLRCEREEEGKQRAAPPRRPTEHLNVSALLFLTKFDLSDELDMFGMRRSILQICWIVVDPLQDLPGFFYLILIYEMTRRLW